ncbi:hypothetical protein ACJX0J_023189, partial [Zea mays]
RWQSQGIVGEEWINCFVLYLLTRSFWKNEIFFVGLLDLNKIYPIKKKKVENKHIFTLATDIFPPMQKMGYIEGTKNNVEVVEAGTN